VEDTHADQSDIDPGLVPDKTGIADCLD